MAWKIVLHLLRIIKKLIKWCFFLIFGFFGFIFIYAEGFERYIATEWGAKNYFKEVNQPIGFDYTPDGLRITTIGQQEGKIGLLGLHGGFGGLRHFENLVKSEAIFEEYYLILIDRPGYGGSKAGIEPNIDIQAEKIAKTLPEKEKVVLWGQSYGAAVAAQMAYANPENTMHLLLTSAALYGEFEPEYSFPQFMYTKFARLFLPKGAWLTLQEYETRKEEVEKVEKNYAQIASEVTLIHGVPDGIISEKNSKQFKENEQTNAKLVLVAGAGHRTYDTATKTIIKELKIIAEKNK